MKRPYEKPTLTDLSLPTARAGWLPGDGKASPQGSCVGGNGVGNPWGFCNSGNGATNPTDCGGGGSPAAQRYCGPGTSAV
jgi:hypothetical protein